MDKKSILVLGIIVIVSTLLGSALLTRGHFWGDDFAQYIMQAQSIVEGNTQEFMRRNIFTNTQSSWHVGPEAYPWGYPLILVPIYAIKGISPLGMKLPGLLFFAGFLVCLYFLGKNRFTRIENLLFVSVFAFNLTLLTFLDQILSDIPYLFFSTLSLVIMVYQTKRTTLQAALLGVAIFLSYFVRTTGILLLTSYLFVGALKAWAGRADRKVVVDFLRRAFVVCFVFGVFFVANALVFPSGEGSYLSQYETFTFEMMRGFINGYFALFGSFLGLERGTVFQYLYYLLCIFFLAGVWARRKKEPVFIVFFVLWMLVVITYPYWQGPRYIFPVLPLFVYFIFQGIISAVNRLPDNYRSVGQYLHYAFWVIVIGVSLYNVSSTAYTNLKDNREINGPFDEFTMQVYDFIKNETPEDSIVVFFKPRIMRLMTDHDTLMIYNCNEFLRGDILVLSKKVGENNQIPPEKIGECELPLDPVFQNRRFVVYEITKSP